MTSKPLIILNLFRYCLHDGQFLGRAYGSALSPTHSLILDEISRGRYTTQRTLSELFGVHQSNISRAVSKLSKLRYIARSRTDRLELNLTESGDNFVREKSRFNQELIAQRSRRLKKREVSELEQLLSSFADGSNAPEVTGRPGESQLFLAIRRLTYAHKLTTESYFDSDVSSVEWSILSEIFYEDLNSAQIIETLGFKPNTANSLLRRLLNDGLLTERPDCKKNLRYFRVTCKGIERINVVEHYASASIAKALKSFTDSEIDSFIRLFATYLSYQPPLSDNCGLTITNKLSQHEHERFEWELVKALVKAKESTRPDIGSLISRRGRDVFLIYFKENLLGGFRLGEAPIFLNLDRTRLSEHRQRIFSYLNKQFSKARTTQILKILMEQKASVVWDEQGVPLE